MDHLIDQILCVVVKGISAQIKAAEVTLGERICQESRRSLVIDLASNCQSPSYAVLSPDAHDGDAQFLSVDVQPLGYVACEELPVEETCTGVGQGSRIDR